MGGLRRASRGYVLLDAVAALVVVLAGFAIVLGALSTVGSATIRQAQRVRAIVEQRNADAKDRPVDFPAR